MAFLAPLIGPALGMIGGIAGRALISKGLQFGAKELAKRGAQSALAGTLGKLLGGASGDIADIAGRGLSALGGVIGGDIGNFISSKFNQRNDATAENVLEEKYLRHIMDRQSSLENVIFGLHNNEFREINRLRALSPELQQIQKIRELNTIGSDIR